MTLEIFLSLTLCFLCCALFTLCVYIVQLRDITNSIKYKLARYFGDGSDDKNS